MARVIGNADDFYRLRVIRIDATGEPDLEWRDDILWRTPPESVLEESVVFRVEAVSLDDEGEVHTLAAFDAPEEAYEWMNVAAADLTQMTKAEFEETYFLDDADL